MKVTMIQCDNPECSSMDRPEDQMDVPYGWWQVGATKVGPGPSLSVVVCIVDCIAPAVRKAREDFYAPDADLR